MPRKRLRAMDFWNMDLISNNTQLKTIENSDQLPVDSKQVLKESIDSFDESSKENSIIRNGIKSDLHLETKNTIQTNVSNGTGNANKETIVEINQNKTPNAMPESNGRQSLRSSENTIGSVTTISSLSSLSSQSSSTSKLQPIKTNEHNITSSQTCTHLSVNIPINCLDKNFIQNLVKNIGLEQEIDEEVEDLLMELGEDFIEKTITLSALIANNRKAMKIDVRDVGLALDKRWNMQFPEFGTGIASKHLKKSFVKTTKQFP